MLYEMIDLNRCHDKEMCINQITEYYNNKRIFMTLDCLPPSVRRSIDENARLITTGGHGMISISSSINKEDLNVVLPCKLELVLISLSMLL